MALTNAQRKAMFAKQQREEGKRIIPNEKQADVFFPRSKQLWHPKSSPSHYPDKHGKMFGGRRRGDQTARYIPPEEHGPPVGGRKKL